METFSAMLRAEREADPTVNTNPVTPELAAPVAGAELSILYNPTQEELGKRVLGYVIEKKLYGRLKNLIPSVVPTDEEAYLRDFVEDVEFDTRVYTLAGHSVRVLIPEEYAQKLDIVRQRRLGQIDLLPEELIGYLNRALPEDILANLDELPNRSYISDVHLVDWANSRDKLTQAIQKSDTFVSDASTMPDGQVMLYKFDVGDWLRTTLFHEWNHHLHKRFMKMVKKLWEAAVHLEWFVWTNRDYAKTSNDEHWAVFGESILQKSGPEFTEIVNKLGPMRTVVWTLALGEALNAVPEDARSPCHDIWVARVAYAQKAAALAHSNAIATLKQAKRMSRHLKNLSV